MVHAGTFGDMLPNFSSLSKEPCTFEPVLENLSWQISVERNQLRNVVLQNAALGSTSEPV